MEEVHYGGKGPHWPVVLMIKEKKKLTGNRSLGRPSHSSERLIRKALKGVHVPTGISIDPA